MYIYLMRFAGSDADSITPVPRIKPHDMNNAIPCAFTRARVVCCPLQAALVDGCAGNSCGTKPTMAPRIQSSMLCAKSSASCLLQFLVVLQTANINNITIQYPIPIQWPTFTE